MCNLRYKGNASSLEGKGCIPSLWNDQVLKVFVMIERRKEKKISHPNRFVDAPTKINSQKISIEEGS
jgi:hypothetical protein